MVHSFLRQKSWRRRSRMLLALGVALYLVLVFIG
jgi:type II secretory pathway component PulM